MASERSRVARGEHVLLRAGGERVVHDGARDADALLRGEPAAGREEQLARGRRLDAHAGALEQRERREVHRLDRFVGPECGEFGHAGPLLVVAVRCVVMRPPWSRAAPQHGEPDGGDGDRAGHQAPHPGPGLLRGRLRGAHRPQRDVAGAQLVPERRSVSGRRQTYPAQRSVRNACRFTLYQSTMYGSSRYSTFCMATTRSLRWVGVLRVRRVDRLRLQRVQAVVHRVASTGCRSSS